MQYIARICCWWAECLVNSLPASLVVSFKHNCLLQGFSIELGAMRSLVDCAMHKELVLTNSWTCAGQQRSVALYQVGVCTCLEATQHNKVVVILTLESAQTHTLRAKRRRAALCPRAFHIDRKHHLELAWQRQQVTLLVHTWSSCGACSLQRQRRFFRKASSGLFQTMPSTADYLLIQTACFSTQAYVVPTL